MERIAASSTGVWLIEQDGDSRDLVGLLGHADLRQRQMGVGRVGAERVQRFEALSFVVGVWQMSLTKIGAWPNDSA